MKGDIMDKLTVPRKQIHIVGGGTIEPIREHLALSARAYGATAKRLCEICREVIPQMDVNIHLTKMADSASDLESSDDLKELAQEIVTDYDTKMVFWNPAVCDFKGEVGDIESAMHAQRLKSVAGQAINLTPTEKIVTMFRKGSVMGQKPRKDIFAVGFKPTTGASSEEQYSAGLGLLKSSSLNLVLANDTTTRQNIVITPEEAPYHETGDRE